YIGRIGLGPHDRMSFLFSPSFAGAVSDIFGALLSGASIHPFAVRSQPLTRLGEWLIQSRITVYHSVPTLFRRLMPLATEPFSDIRIVKLGGEAVTVNDFELFRSHFPDTCRFHFGLTASETNFVCDELLDRSSSLEGHQVPLGLPIEDKRVMILDDQGQPVPQGETGEIAVESRYLSPGYWGTPREIGDRPEFPGNSGLSPISGSRIYRMGDLGKILPDGRIVHVGRKDNQVKIRGHRVELSEIDLALQADPAVREAVTIARPDASGELSLVSFVVAAREEIEEGTLRSALRSRLPEAFIPAAIQLVPDLPRNPNGKIDRSALAAIEISRGETAARRGDSTIDRLHEIWVESGGRAGIAADNDLFACGDSLGVIHFFGAVEIAFHRRLPLTSLMQSVTLARVAEILDRESELDTRRIFPLRTSGDRQRLFFIPGMGAHFLGILKLTKALGEEYPCYGVQYSGVDGDATRRLDRVETIAADFLELIRSIQPAGPYALIGSSFGGVVAWEMGLQLLAAGERVTFLGLLDTRCPSAANLPPWRRAAELRREGKSVLRYSVWWFRRMAGMPWRRIRALFAHRLVGRDSSLPQALRVVELRNMNAAERYRVRPYPFSATLFRASEGIVKLTRDPSLGWRQWAGELEVIEVPGSHRTMTRGREVVELAAALRAALDRATARAGAAEAGQKPAVDDGGRDVEF
ncbi:MAG TPA: alpha/beta fold hydrolase, partial [Thermoanaerobaculia bacterium]|nr:alpha/beta fold hydrolase [Thermoanaerobaculia bacterium]